MNILSCSLHGGTIAQAALRFQIPSQEWIDLSTGINPWHYPLPDIPPQAWYRLPDTPDIIALLNAARHYYQVPKSAHLVAAPGSQTIIQILPYFFSSTSVAIVSPTYSEHQYCWNKSGHITTEINNLDLKKIDPYQIIIVTNPNNPTGRRILPKVLISVLRKLSQKNGLLVVDEAFADVDPRLSMVPYSGSENLIVLRSFGKFFGLAGIRLGVAITGPHLSNFLIQSLGPWPINGPAMIIGQQAYQDSPWISKTQQKLSSQIKTLDHLLSHHQLKVVGGTNLFRLIQTDKAQILFETSARAGILLRTFDYAPSWIRIGIPPNQHAFTKLHHTLSNILN